MNHNNFSFKPTLADKPATERQITQHGAKLGGAAKTVIIPFLVLLATMAVVSSCVPPASSHPFHLHPWAVCVRQHESDRAAWPHDKGYQAQNPRSTASGAYQMLDGTWKTLSQKAGVQQYQRAGDAPGWAQDEVAQWAWSNGYKNHWKAC